jgi:hypothetical protein
MIVWWASLKEHLLKASSLQDAEPCIASKVQTKWCLWQQWWISFIDFLACW